MLKATSRCIYIVCFLALGFYGFYSLLQAAEVDQADPNAVTKAILLALQTSDYTTIIALMPEEKRSEYQAIISQNPADMDRIFTKYKANAKDIIDVTEFRLMTTFEGKDGMAGMVKKVGGEIFVIILVKEADKYYYDSSLFLTQKSYKELPPFIKE